MLYISTDIRRFDTFKQKFKSEHERGQYIDLSKIPSYDLLTEVSNAEQHIAEASIFLGYLEPGWMLMPQYQTLMRHAIRKFRIGMVCHYLESLPHSWKNEIHTLYTVNPNKKNGDSQAFNDGSTVQHEPTVRHNEAPTCAAIE